VTIKETQMKKRSNMEESGEIEGWSVRQRNVMPKLEDAFIGFKIQMLFQFNAEDGATYLNW